MCCPRLPILALTSVSVPPLEEVIGRLEYMEKECFAQDVVYHNMCRTNFMNGSQIPTVFADEEPVKKKLKFSVGRPEDKVRQV